MRNIEVAVLSEAHSCPAGMMTFLAKLTQRGHNISNMDDLLKLYMNSMFNHNSAKNIAALPHGTIKRFSPITIAIVGASRRFLAQARTNQVGFNYVSASLQYSDYTSKAAFTVPYSIIEHDTEAITSGNVFGNYSLTEAYTEACLSALETYESIAARTDNDTAGYVMPQGLRNVLVMQGNHEAWSYFIRLRACNRNTDETAYVATRIWEELLKTADGKELFAYAGPDCLYGKCREGKMTCGSPIVVSDKAESIPSELIKQKWPLLIK